MVKFSIWRTRITSYNVCYTKLLRGGQISPNARFIDVANSGTTLRIFSALAALGNHEITFDGDASIRKRPSYNFV